MLVLSQPATPGQGAIPFACQHLGSWSWDPSESLLAIIIISPEHHVTLELKTTGRWFLINSSLSDLAIIHTW